MDEQRGSISRIGDINSAEATKTLIIPRKKRICLVGDANQDPTLSAAAQHFKVPVITSETGTEYVEDTSYNTYFVLKQFEGPEYDALCKSAHRILGPTALLQLAEKKESLPSLKRPMYTQAMVGSVVVFSGFRTKEDELRKLAAMVLNMGGSIRKEMGTKITHLIANHCGGEKYRYADTFSLPIMSADWVVALWNARDDVYSYAFDEELIATYKLKPFYETKICFFGFPEEEKRHMYEVLEQQGGEPAEIDDPNCTHVVIDVPDPYYRKCNNARLSYLKNSHKQYPLSSMNFKPILSYLHNPCLDAVCNTTNIDNRNNNDVANIDSMHFAKSQDNFSLSKDILSTSVDLEHNTCSDLISYNVSKDSAVGMEDNYCDLQTSVIKSGHIFNHFAEQSDSGLDLTKSSNLSTFSAHGVKCSIPTTSTMISNKNVKFHISDNSLFDNEYSQYDIASQFSTIAKDLKPSVSSEKNNLHDVCTSSISNKSVSLKYRKNVHYIQNNTSKIKVIPKRYIKWKKANSCTSVHKMAKLDKCKFLKVRSFPNIWKHRDEQYSDVILHNASRGERRKHSFESHISNFSEDPSRLILSDDEQDIFTNSYCSPSENTLFKTKCTFLSKSFPALSTQTAIAKHELKSTFISNGKTCNPPFISHNTKTLYEDLMVQEDKSLSTVVDESNVSVIPHLVSKSALIVKTGWFWTSVQNAARCDENEYLFEHYLETVLSPTASGRRDSQQSMTLPNHPYLSKPLSNLLQYGANSPANVSGSFLDNTASPEKQLQDDIETIATDSIKEHLSKRHKVFLELVETESNYVGILNTIMTLFKLPLENLIGKSGKELLNSTEVKIIFGNFPPIYDVHKQLLEALHYSAANWTEDISIGKIFLKFEPDLVKAYPPYVNFFENTKQMLEECDQNKPRFHAFLKNCQTIPDCGRQSLKELLIKPIQRLPSISLLLNDILKHTDKSNPDYNALEASLSCIKKVMTYINENKRKTERQLAIFDIFNEIDNCPPHLVSSRRSFISKCDVMEVTEGLSGRGDHLVLFLFTDTLEICKKRSKTFNSKSPSANLQSIKLNQGKPYKHVKMLSLTSIRKVVDIRETDECQKVFALVVRNTQELKEKLLSFVIIDEEVNKAQYLETLCKQMAFVIRIADADTLLIRYDSRQLEVSTSDVASGTLKKTIKFASRTRARVGRAFSFNKTPSKLNRAMSTIMSPFGSTHGLAPTNPQIAQMRLGSCNNISVS